MNRIFNITIFAEYAEGKDFPDDVKLYRKLKHFVNKAFRGFDVINVTELSEPYRKTIKKLENALYLACEKVPIECPDPPERYNMQYEMGLDTPYWITDGGCEEENPNCSDCMRQCFLRKAAAQIKDDPLDWYL